MRTGHRTFWRVITMLAAVVVCLMLGARANPGSRPHSAAARTPKTSTSACGTKPGVKATGSPIKLGAIATNQPGTSFTDIPYMARAYFNCVNNNGGIKGHKIQLIVETEQTNPAQIAAEAKQLVQTDHVVGIVGNTSIIECDVDSAYWKSHGFFIIDSGIASECYGSSNSAGCQYGTTIQLRRCGPVRDRARRQEDRVRPVERPWHRIQRGRDRGDLQARPHSVGTADRERADLGRRLGCDQGGRGRGFERRCGAQLHAA